MTNGRLNIGLFICHLDNDYANDICKGVDWAVRELDANLIIFPGMYIGSTYNDPVKARYDYQYNSIFYYASAKNLDVLIVSVGTIGSFLAVENIKAFLDNFKDLPILTLEFEVPGYPFLYVEGKSGLKDTIEHLINVHHRKEIGFVSGREFNVDAVDRLNVYKETMEEHGFEVKEKLIVHGDFSEYCEEQVEELLDNNPHIDAIVFANDQMALGGYNVLKRRGIQIGKDISVTGFDDSAVALALDPPLTTVQACVPDLGYRSVYESINVLHHGKPNQSVLNSSIVIRESCGCVHTNNNIDINGLDMSQIHQMSQQDIAAAICSSFLEDFKNYFYYKSVHQILYEYTLYLTKGILSEDMNQINISALQELLAPYFSKSIYIYFEADKLSYFVNNVTDILLKMTNDNSIKIDLLSTTNTIHRFINGHLCSIRYKESRDYKLQSWNSCYIPRDTLNYGKDNAYCFSNMIEKLKTVKFISSFIYEYDDPIMQLADGTWRIPEQLLLTVYNNDYETQVLDHTYVKASDVFTNPYTPNDRRHTFIVNPLFTNDQQHGLYICEIPLEYHHHVYSTDLQLGTAFKFLYMLREQTSTHNQLVLTLQEIHDKNKLLNEISISDALTGLYNRRGFLENAQRFMNAPEHKGKKAIIVYADMDNLKIVNDKFGHKNGDYALRSIATTLKKSFRPKDVIGRIGGDEFVAFAILDEPDLINHINHHIEHYSAQVNETSGKPYYIDVTTGISEFICGEGTSIEDILSDADSALYNNKKYKRKSVLKN